MMVTFDVWVESGCCLSDLGDWLASNRGGLVDKEPLSPEGVQ